MFGWFKKKEEQQKLQKLPEYKDLAYAFELNSNPNVVISFHKNGNFDDISMTALLPPKRKPDLIENLSVGYLKDGNCIKRNEFFLKEGIVTFIDEENEARNRTNNPAQPRKEFYRIGIVAQCPVTKLLMVFWNDNNCWTFVNKKMCDAYNNYVANTHLLDDVEQQIVDNSDSEEW